MAPLEQFRNIFPQPKPVIAMIHLPPLLGSPAYSGQFEEVVEQACGEVRILSNYGVAGIIVENYGDQPFFPGRVPPETVAAMTRVATEVRRIIDLPLGINVLRNDAISALSIAEAVGAQFIRTNVHVGMAASEQGLLMGKAHEVLRFRAFLKSECLIFADIAVKHSYPLYPQSADEMLRDTVVRGLADAVIVTGAATGMAADLRFAKEVKGICGKIEVPLLIGSGITPESINSAFEIADAVIVGTYLKKEGVTANPIDRNRVEKLMQAVGGGRQGN